MKFLEKFVKIKNELGEIQQKCEFLTRELDNNISELVNYLENNKLLITSDPTSDPKQFINHYECECGNRWEDTWFSTCDDECSDCGRRISPYESEDV
jgi:hypothetical protein